MAASFLHQHRDFEALLRIVGRDGKIDPFLVEMDYWIMHVLYGLQQKGMAFEHKGGTSLSKGFGIIDRFSEDIDILIHPPAERQVKENPKNTKEGAVQSRRDFYDWLAANIRIGGIVREAKRFPAADRNIPVAQNQAFLIDDPAIRNEYRQRYERTTAIYYRGQPPFDELLARIKNYVDRL